MRFLLRRDTRAARWVVLKTRVRELIEYGTDAAELYLALRFTIYGVVILIPGDTTGVAPAWRFVRRILGGDPGVGVVCLIVGICLFLTVLELWGDRLRQAVLVGTLAISIGFAVGFYCGYPLSPGGYDMSAIAFICWLCYLRERDR